MQASKENDVEASKRNQVSLDQNSAGPSKDDSICELTEDVVSVLKPIENIMAAVTSEIDGDGDTNADGFRNTQSKKTFMPTDDNNSLIVLNDGLRIFLTTKRLLQYVSNERLLYIDTSFKIIRQLPLSVFGVTDDFDKSFKPVGVAITIGEAVADYEFIFMSINDILDYEYKPKSLISIANPAIRQASENVFGSETTIFVCSLYARKSMYHLLTNDCSINKEDRMEIMKDFETMLLITSSRRLTEHIYPFLLKWNKYETFVNKFREIWVTEYPNWSHGVDMKSLECIFHSMKEMHSIDKIKQCVEHWSKY